MNTPRRTVVLAFAAALAAAFTLAAFYPGYLSFDAADQWRQARHFSFNDLHPPLPALLWHGLDRLWPGPGGLFVLQVGLYWATLALFVGQMPWRTHTRVLALWAIGLWPPLFGLLPHLWKDVWMAILLGMATALLLADVYRPAGWRRLVVVLVLILAGATRHNALPALLPFALLLVEGEARQRGWQWSSVRRMWAGIGLSVVITLVAQLPNRLPMVTHTDSPWSVIALWDLAAVSIAEQRMLIPPELRRDDVDLDLLRTRFLAYSNTSLFIDDAFRHSLFEPYDAAQRSALPRAWLGLPFTHPRAYFTHRLRLSGLLLGCAPSRLPDRMVLMPGIVELPDNPSVAAASGRLNRTVQGGLNALIDTPVFAGGLYLLLAAAAAAWAWPRRRRAPMPLALAVAASGLLYAASLTIVAGSAEFRYLDWPVLAALLAAALAFARITATSPRCPPA